MDLIRYAALFVYLKLAMLMINLVNSVDTFKSQVAAAPFIDDYQSINQILSICIIQCFIGN